MSCTYRHNGKLYSEQPEGGGVKVVTRSILRLQDQFIRGTELQGQYNLSQLVRTMVRLNLILLDTTGTRFAPASDRKIRRDELLPEIKQALEQGVMG